MVSSASAPGTTPETPLVDYYLRLLSHFGPQGWWPARSRMEVILGAILTQNTSWRNAARALARLRARGLLRARRLRQTTRTELEGCVRPAGFYRQKAAAIRNFVEWLDRRHGGSLDALFTADARETRRDLLGLKGLGPETADAILLYAGKKPFFVADAYTRRMLYRHGLIRSESDYDLAQAFLHHNLPRDQGLFNELHALIVEAGKRYCKRQEPLCGACPLRAYLPTAHRRPRQQQKSRPTTNRELASSVP